MLMRSREGRTPAEARDLDSIRHLENVRHVVAYEYDRQSAVTNGSDEIEHLTRFAYAQGSSCAL
jgi:hypothetical protein